MAYSVTVLSRRRAASAADRRRGGPTATSRSSPPAPDLAYRSFIWIDGRYIPMPSEGGHSDFAARTDREIELLRFLRERYGRAEIEHVLSGPGLVNLSDFTHGSQRCAVLVAHSENPDLPAEVTRSALVNECACCVDALEMFVTIYGSVAGNFALSAVSRGGVFIGGGIAPKILPALQRASFLRAFNDKPPMSPLLQAMSVHVILNPDVGLVGAAVYASQSV